MRQRLWVAGCFGVCLSLAGLDARPVTAGEGSFEIVSQLIATGHYPEAELEAQLLLSQTKETEGGESIEVARALDLLVQAKTRNGRAAEPETRPLAERAIAIKEAVYGPDHPEVATTLIIFARVCDYAEGESICRRSLEIRENSLGPEHPLVAESLQCLGLALYRQADYVGARPILELSRSGRAHWVPKTLRRRRP